MPLQLRHARIPLLAVGILMLLLLTLWLAARYLYADGNPSVRLSIFVGWLSLTLLLTTFTAIIQTAATTHKAITTYALLTTSTAILITLIGLATGLLGWGEILRLSLLFSSWLALACALAITFGRWGPGAAVAIPATLLTLLMAAPVAAIPLARATTGLTQDYILKAIGIASPFLAQIDALHPAIKINWAQLPGMYALSGLGQDIPMALPTWYLNTLIYAATALLLLALSRLPRRLS